MYSPQVCSTSNANQLMFMLYRPLYWFGNNYRPTVDYSYSIGQAPQFSNGDKVVTVKLNPGWKWSDGEPVTSRDVVFWMNMLKASPATEWCGYVPGYFPDNVTSYSAPDASTVVFHLNKAYNPTYFLYNGLAQITPLPLAWDRTSLSQPAPRSDNGRLPGHHQGRRRGRLQVPRLARPRSSAAGRRLLSGASWTGRSRSRASPRSGQVTLVPNPDYSGSPKPSISKLVELPFTSETAIYNQIRSGGPSALTIANLPAQYAPADPDAGGAGVRHQQGGELLVQLLPAQLQQPEGGPIFRQPYFRQALQHLIDQPGWIHAFLHDTANPTYGPIPLSPPSPLVERRAIWPRTRTRSPSPPPSSC